jgi:hypothetical protein
MHATIHCCMTSFFSTPPVPMQSKNSRISLIDVDADRLEPHNRDATVGNTPRDHGQPKATVLLRYLHRIRPSARLHGLIMPLQAPRVLPALRRCDAIFLCVDNDCLTLRESHPQPRPRQTSGPLVVESVLCPLSITLLLASPCGCGWIISANACKTPCGTAFNGPPARP